MSKILAKFVNLDATSMQADADNVAVLPAPGEGLERSASGLRVKAGEVTEAMLASAFKNLVAYLSEDEDVTGAWTFNTALPTSSLTPSADNQLTTKAYVDSVAEGLDVKESVRAATVGNITLSGAQTIDGVSITNERVLVKDQTIATQNGIYVAAIGAWARAADFDTDNDASPGAFTFVEEGTVNGDSGWVHTTDGPVTLGTTSLTFSQFSGAGTIAAGAGLTKDGSTINFEATDNSLTVGADSVAVNVDNSTIETNVTNGVQVKAAGITHVQISSAALGLGMTGGSGTTISFDPAAMLTGGAKEVDGDKLDIDFTPTNYTPSTAPAEADNVDNLTAHLAGIDNALAGKTTRRVETFTLSATDITNKYVTLANTPAAAGRVVLAIKGAGGQFYGDDYQMDGVTPTRLTWSALALDGVLASGDKLTVEYDA